MWGNYFFSALHLDSCMLTILKFYFIFRKQVKSWMNTDINIYITHIIIFLLRLDGLFGVAMIVEKFGGHIEISDIWLPLY